VPNSSVKNTWCVADLCQYLLEYFHEKRSLPVGAATFQAFVETDIIATTVPWAPQPFGFPVVVARFVDEEAGITDSRWFPFFRFPKGTYTASESDLLGERPWYHSLCISFEPDGDYDRWLLQVVPSIRAVIESLYDCDVTTSVEILELNGISSRTVVRFFVGEDTTGHTFFASSWTEGVDFSGYGWQASSGNEPATFSLTRPFLDFDPDAGIGAWRTIETIPGTGVPSDTPVTVQLSELILGIRDLVDETARVADSRQSISLNNGAVRIETNPTEIITPP
jgi:hypothetical protein